MIIEQCPHCQTRHVQAEARFAENLHPNRAKTTWQVVRCQNPQCRLLVLVVLTEGSGVQTIYPLGAYELDSTAKITNEIRDDFREAGTCLAAGCYRASLVMSRRVLQRCLKEQGCADHNLVDAIDTAIKTGVLRKTFHPIATEIRQYGNLGAHPDDDNLANADNESATQVLDFTRLLIHEFFEVPATADALRKKREGTP
jgi:hypothetical protein